MKSWNKIREQPFNAGFRKMIKKTFKLPDGREVDFDIKKEGPVVCVLALTKDNEVVLAKHFRPGPEKVLSELPGGAMEDGERPEKAIERELLEECGYTGNFQLVGTTLDCAYSTMVRYNFVATDSHKVQEQKLDDNEFIEVVEMPLDDFREHLKTGQLSDVEVGYRCLDFLGLL